MDKKSYFLQLENQTKAYFQDIIDDGVKVIVSPNAYDRFYKLHTEPGQPDASVVQELEKSGDYECFYLNIAVESDAYISFDLDNVFGGEGFELEDTFIASVYIPKDNPNMKSAEYRKLHLDYVLVALENYYNNANDWFLFITDKNGKYDGCSDTDYLLFYDGNKFSQEDEQWFEMCREKYGITDTEILAAKNIIQSYKYRIFGKYSENTDTFVITTDTKK